MSIISCFVQTCDCEAEFSCDCTSPATFSCKNHIANHLENSSQSHNLTSMFLKPSEGTKEAILRFLTEEMTKTDKTKVNVINIFYEALYGLKGALKEILKGIDSDSTKISTYFEKILQMQKVSRLEKDPALSLLTLQPDEAISKAKAILKENSNEKLSEMNSQIDKIIKKFEQNLLKLIQCESNLKLEGTSKVESTSKLESTLKNKSQDLKADPKNYKEKIGRIREEYNHVQDNMPDWCSVLLNRGNVEKWIISIYGPNDTPYEGGCFNIDCTFPYEYPDKPPICLIRKTNILHMNFHPDGDIKLGVLRGDWHPEIRMAALIENIRFLIANPKPHYCFACHKDLINLYLNNRKEYIRVVSNHTRVNAM